MKIADVQCVAVQAPGRTLVMIVVKTDGGVAGVGEAGLQRRWKAIAGAVEHVRPWLVGEDPRRIEHLWQRLFRGGFYPGDRLMGSVISGIDIALWDIKGQMLGVPIYELLGGRCRDWVQVFAAPTYRTLDAKADAGDLLKSAGDDPEPAVCGELARRCIEKGHRYFRLGLPNPRGAFDARYAARRLVEQLRAARDAAGDRLELMVDLHTRLSPEEAVWFCKEVEDLQMYCVEDPIRSEHLAGYQRIRQQTRVPIAAGEQWANKWEFREAIERELIDFARIDLCIAGGITEAKKIAAMAETHLVKLLMHNPLGPVCTAASLHMDLACDNAGPQEVIFDPAVMLPEVFRCDFAIDGKLRLGAPMAAGLGVSFDEVAARRYPAEMTEPPHFRREDGSFTNY